DPLPQHGRELGLLDRGVHAPPRLVAFEAADLGDEVEEGARRHVAVAGRALREVAEPGLGRLRALGHVDADDAGAAGVGLQEARQHLHGGRLAGAVGPEEAQHLAALDLKGNAVDGDDVAEPLFQIGSFDQGRHWSLPPSVFAPAPYRTRATPREPAAIVAFVLRQGRVRQRGAPAATANLTPARLLRRLPGSVKRRVLTPAHGTVAHRLRASRIG